MAAEHYQVVTTTDSEAETNSLSAAIVRERLGACVHVLGPMQSVYRWDGEIARDTEWRLVIKTAADRLAALIEFIETNHSYDVPQIVATKITAGGEEYLRWVTEETRPA